MPTPLELRNQSKNKPMYFLACIPGEEVIVIEACNRQVAADMYAFLVGTHPDTTSCSCCGPVGYCHSIIEEWALEEIENDVRFVFNDEYTVDDIASGSELYYEYKERLYY